MEMTAEEISDRLVAIHLKINPDDLLEGRLSPENKEKFLITKDNFEQYNLRVIEGNMVKNLTELISEARDYNPDIVFIDGSYMLRPDRFDNESDWLAQGKVHQILKTDLAMKSNVPVVCTVQENRLRKQSKDGDGIIARSDIIEQVASTVISIQRLKGNEQRRVLEIVKNRHGRHGKIVINFIFRNMNMDIDEEETHKEQEKLRNAEAKQNQHQQMQRTADAMRS
jgi:replicative DNA helicase